jgi:glycosyltransferase involved in cell wall biosynthesis
MKLLLLTHLYPSAREPARGIYNHRTFRALSAYCEVRVVSPRPWWHRGDGKGPGLPRPWEWLKPHAEEFGGLPAVYPTYWTLPRLAPALAGPAMAASLLPIVARLRRDFPFDGIVAAWGYPDGAAAARIAERYGCPLITRVMGSDVNQLGQDPRLRPHLLQALRRCYRVVAVSDALRDRLVSWGLAPERVVVQHNAVDGERFRPRDRRQARATLGLPGDRPILAYVGRLSHEKGPDVLLEAIARLRAGARRETPLLTLVGDGAQAQALRAQAERLGIAGADGPLPEVQFVGERASEEVPLWLSACDALCLPSRREGCPNVLLEALASGRPVVASRVGGVPELLCEGTGVMVPPDDPIALAEGLHATLSRSWDPERLRRSVEYLSWDAVGLRYHDLMAAAIDERLDSSPASW